VKTQVVTVYPGQRLALMVKLDQTPADYTIRFADNGAGQIVSGYAVLRYRGGHPLKNYTVGYTLPLDQKDGYTLYGGVDASNSTTTFDTLDPTPPYPPNPPAVPKKEGDELFVLTMGRYQGAWKWTMRGKEMYAADRDAYTPLLYYPNSTDALDEELVIRTKNGSWVDIILQVGALPGESLEIGHAIHKHGTKFYVMGKGLGVWNYTSVAAAIEDQPASFNITNPNIRDTAITEFVGAMWVAIRYQSKNPGFWLLHCHVETHLAGGMGLAVMDGYDVWPTIPPEYALGQHGFPVHGGFGFTAPCQNHHY
jgi:FtsP/CotA-like multicopper oxidase with cupredoxin domain